MGASKPLILTLSQIIDSVQAARLIFCMVEKAQLNAMMLPFFAFISPAPYGPQQLYLRRIVKLFRRSIIMNSFNNLNMDEHSIKLTRSWMLLAILSLLFAGLFAFLIAMARTPFVMDLLPGKNYFRVALVTHVNLAFVIWFLAFMGALWTIMSTGFLKVKNFSPLLGWIGFSLSTFGTVFLIIPAILGWGTPVLSNYVPVLTHPLFYAGLIMFASGVFITIANAFLSIWLAMKERTYTKPFPLCSYGMSLTGITFIVALICFALAYLFLSQTSFSGDQAFFERLFWGGGHILQFTNTAAMVTIWILLTSLTLNKPLPFSDRLAKLFLWIFLIFALPAPFLYFVNDVSSQGYKNGFTILMEIGLGPTTGLFIMGISFIIWSYNRGSIFSRVKLMPWNKPGFSSLVLSIAIFIIGGLISLMLHGSNVKIPSHYHAVIGGVTLSFMGLTYYILPMLKKEVFSPKTAKIQPFLYGIGQILFVIGMFWAGTHQVQRKTYGADQVLNSIPEYAGMTIMGLGGVIAIAGGALFVINALISLLTGIRREVGITSLSSILPSGSVMQHELGAQSHFKIKK